MNRIRCVNLDWLEVYCLESNLHYPHDAEYFRSCGYHVSEREYGTPIYEQMFTVFGPDDRPMIEVRRKPKQSSRPEAKASFLDPYSCHIRLTNRTCYLEDAAGILQSFLEAHQFSVSRISRMDVCLDFVKFDEGDDPQKFIIRYLENKYSKINQAKVNIHGFDMWDGRSWNSLKWGNDKSMVTTKLYNKTMELQQVSDKPYIRQAWRLAGLIDDELTCSKYDAEGRPHAQTIWRLEFSVKSGRKNWFEMEVENGRHKKLSIRHTLDMYHTRAQLLDVFWSLQQHYFHFKRVEFLQQSKAVAAGALSAVTRDRHHDLVDGVAEQYRKRQRKDRCTDKVLFKQNEPAHFYKVAHVATATKPAKPPQRLLRLLYEFRDKVYRPELYRAATEIIEYLEFAARTENHDTVSAQDLTLIRLLISLRTKTKEQPLDADIARLRAILEESTDYFGELPLTTPTKNTPTE